MPRRRAQPTQPARFNAGEVSDRARPAAYVGLAASLTSLVIAIALLPPPPVILFIPASLAFAAALIVRPVGQNPGVRDADPVDRAEGDLV